MRWSDICVQGVDLSLSATGLVTIRDGHAWVETIHTDSTWTETRRRRHIARRVYAALGDVRPAVVAVEEPIHGISNKTTIQLASLHGVVRDHLWRPGIAVTDVHLSRLKVFGAGGGRASKDEMLRAAREQLTPYLGWAQDDNQADAMWLACMGLLHVGQLPFPASGRQRTIVQSLTWPNVEGVHT